MVLSGNGSGRIEVSVSKIETTASVDLQPDRVIARRAGQTVSGTLGSSGEAGAFSGSIQLPSPGLWFIYAEFTDGTQSLEIWLPVQHDLESTRAEQRALYEPVGTDEHKPLVEYLAGGLLLVVSAALVGWLIAAVQRSRRTVRTATR